MAGFADLAAILEELEGIPSRVSSEVAQGINALLKEEFDNGTDPYGNPWTPLLPQTIRRKGGDTRILRDTDALSSGTIAKASQGAGVEIVSIEYGQYHQATRQILPEGELPTAWQDVIEQATERAFKKVMK